MSASATDCNLLLGMLALQLNFIDRDQLIEAMNAWMLDKERPLERILLDQQAVSPEISDLLVALVEKHLDLHDGHADKSLAALGSVDENMRQQLSQMADVSLETTLCRVASASTDGTPPPPTSSRRGEVNIAGGRFRILRPHAKGGLGKVSVALDEELNREVALKEIQPQYAHLTDTRARFLQEAEITGRLEHPGIVPVYGLGRDADGRPFYAMRFVRGESLKDAIGRFHHKNQLAADDRPLQLRKLLGRFIDVCEAIEYAHSRGVLHRDLKPDNVMLGKYGETLVVDWGLAKVIGRAESEGSTEDNTLRPSSGSAPTQAGSVVGTPAYMSPEQAAGKIDQLDRSSDVYSLGATLYTLLTGERPFSSKVEVVLAQVERGDFAPPRERNGHVPRSLEAICLKAMALRPQDRYPSARALADDVEHWLADEQVSAYRDRLQERAGRWLRKHRSAAVTGAAALLVVAVVSTIAALLINQQKQQIATLAASESVARWTAEIKRQEAERAHKQADRAHAMARQAVDEVGNLAHDLRRNRPLLERAANYYRQLIEDASYRLLFEQLNEDASADSSEQQHAVAKAQVSLATLLVALNDFAAAESAYKEGIALYESLVSTDSPPALRSELATAYGNLGSLYHLTFREQDGIEAFNRAIELQQQVVADSPDVVVQRRELARHYFNRGLSLSTRHMDDAQKDLHQAIDLLRKLLEEQPDLPRLQHYLADSLVQLGATLMNQADRTRAQGGLLAALQVGKLLNTAQKSIEDGVSRLDDLLRKQPTHSEYRKDRAVALSELGRILATKGDQTQAQERFQEAIDLLAQLLRGFPNDPDFRRKLALAHFSLGIVHKMSRRFDESQTAYRSAIEIQQQLATEFPQATMLRVEVAKSWTNLAEVQHYAGNSTAAIESVETAIEQMQTAWKMHADNEPLRGVLYQMYVALAQLAIATGDHESLVKGGESHAALQPSGAQDLFDSARLIALAIPLLDRDDELGAEEKRKTADK